MKKNVLLALCVFCLVQFARAQETSYHKFKVGLDFGLGSAPAGSLPTKASADIVIEPHYRFSDQFELGLKFQNVGIFGISNSDYSGTVTALTADYYFNKADKQSSVVFFGGGGVGAYSIDRGSASVDVSARIGLETGHFRPSIEYNINDGPNNILLFNLGFFFGGGKK
jgi:hypothetical protein